MKKDNASPFSPKGEGLNPTNQTDAAGQEHTTRHTLAAERSQPLTLPDAPSLQPTKESAALEKSEPTTERRDSPLANLLSQPTATVKGTLLEPGSRDIHTPVTTRMVIPEALLQKSRERSFEKPTASLPGRSAQPLQPTVEAPASPATPEPVDDRDPLTAIRELEALTEDPPRYKALECIGEGAMGEIWKAEDLSIGRLVAIKRRKQQLTPEALALFVEESRTTGQLEHSNIVTIHDVGIDHTGREFIVMRFIEGQTLKEIIAALREGDEATHRRFPIEVRLQLMVQVLSALIYAHEKGIIHRDIKPDNIMVGTHGEITLMDWGISLIKHTAPTREGVYPSNEMLRTLVNQDFQSLLDQEHKRRETNPGEDSAISLPKVLFGTPAYMSPEQLQAESRSDERTDVYSFCVTLYEFLTLHHYLEDASTLLSVLFGVQQKDPLPAETFTNPLQGRIPREWSFVLQKGMQKNPAHRYQSAAELLHEMQCNLRGDLTVGCSSTRIKRWGHRGLRFFDNFPVPAVALFCLFTLLALFGFLEAVRLLVF